MLAQRFYTEYASGVDAVAALDRRSAVKGVPVDDLLADPDRLARSGDSPRFVDRMCARIDSRVCAPRGAGGRRAPAGRSREIEVATVPRWLRPRVVRTAHSATVLRPYQPQEDLVPHLLRQR